MKKLLNNQIKIGITLFTALVLSSSFAFANFENIDCEKDQKVLGISTVECQVLEKLWTSTNGKYWQENQNWDSLSKIDTWEGVTVDNSKISSLLLYSNNLVGTIPFELGKLSGLKKLSFYNNSLKGDIPESLGELSELSYLDLGYNNLKGTIPQTLGLLTNLTELYLNNNQFSGNIPDALGNLDSLHVLKMYDNNLSGRIPSTFGSLLNLEILSLAKNSLIGEIPSQLGGLSKLIYLDLKSNKLSGSIPDKVGNLESLTGLYLQKNRLTGDIPSELGELSNLTDLDLSDNKLSGTLPSSLGSLTVLTYLNIAYNELSGDLPVELLNLSRMYYLNIIENKFLISNIEHLHDELSDIPVFITSLDVRAGKTECKSSVNKSIPISVSLINENEMGTLEPLTLKIVGTQETGDSLFVENEGRWSIEYNRIVFIPIAGFIDTPTSIFYTIKNNDGVELKPIKISVKKNKTEAFKINVLENESRDIEKSLLEILLPKDFLDEHPGTTLSQDRKKLIVDSEGTWKVENNGSITFNPEEGFMANPTHIEYVLYKNSREKSVIGVIYMSYKINRKKESSQTNSVALFGNGWLFLMMLFSGLFGMFYLREIDKKKI